MTRVWLSAFFALGLSLSAASAESLDGAETYDLLFRDGTLDTLKADETLLYRRDVSNALKPDEGANSTGDIVLSLQTGDDAGMALLELRQGEKSRPMGRFPSSVGNPMIMVFYESIIRDMAATAGGSPFYIRNRVKEALVRPSDVESGVATLNGAQIKTQTIRMRPFEDDPNVDRMQGFGSLEMTVIMSDEVPGWYLSLVAEAGSDDAPVYLSDMRFVALETAE
ncbi:MAG: hypothetical protein AAGF79_07655 [Pseudomonadota bacterium]